MSKLRLSPCIEMFWPDVPFPERIGKAAALGFEVFEFWGWWDKDLDAVERAAKDAGIQTSVCCVKTAFSGDVPPMLLPDGRDAFVQAVKDCLPVRDKLGCGTFIVTTGNELDAVSRDAQRAACVNALKAAAPVAEDEGITLVLEPLNLLVDHAGYYLSTSEEGFGILAEVDSPAVKLLFDIYHQQITEGNLVNNILNNIERIGHFHAANHPGRCELALGELNYAYIMERIAGTDYDGFFGLEFKPSAPGTDDEVLAAVKAMV